ncbi:MAG: hypothetical protein H6604_02410 [Flavobacteriales bacterium]|nr:hypothetical protein [Flavobacteriales bacterium]
MKATVFLAILVGLFATQLTYSQELATVNVKNYNGFTNEISENTVYPESSLQNLDEGKVIVRFILNDSHDLQKIDVVGNTSLDLKDAIKESITNYVATKGETLDSNLVYELPVRFVIE